MIKENLNKCFYFLEKNDCPVNLINLIRGLNVKETSALLDALATACGTHVVLVEPIEQVCLGMEKGNQRKFSVGLVNELTV